MLKKLSVNNYVLIDQLDIRLEKGLSIITGETGAGKSIILGALGMISGQRVDASLLLNKEKKCIVEAVFEIAPYHLQEFFSEHELDYDKETTVRREINTEGKSRAFVNDTPVGLALLKELSSKLLDIHSQHETLLLSDGKFQMHVLDAYAGNVKQLEKYKVDYKNVKELRKELTLLKEAEKQSKADLDYFTFQFDELNSVQLISGEQELLEQEQERLEHSGDILLQLGKAMGILREEDNNIIVQLLSVQQSLNAIKKYDEKFSLLAERINSSLVELKDVYDEVESAAATFQVDPNRLEFIGDRLSSIYNLQKKHRVNTVEELLMLKEDLDTKITAIGSLEDQLLALTSKQNEAIKMLELSGEELSKSRHAAIPLIEKEITKQLAELSMPHAVFKIKLVKDKDEGFLPEGMEKIVFMFSANKGVDFKELGKVASGGEMSRLMLCIKALLARLSAMPTVIFDEIDTGISGETAARVGTILKQMAKNHQVLAITHLPQLASKGDDHFLVYKEVRKGLTRSFLKKLEEQERVNEIARMLSGEALSAAALENAKDLLSQ
ncbi:MAG: DNA repair protein RecN [Bacteroidetes bacterium]|nr:DNA repair protein RecN [Bacteroidota bacterium]